MPALMIKMEAMFSSTARATVLQDMFLSGATPHRESSPVTGLMLIEVPPAAAAHGNKDAMKAHTIIGAQASRA